MDEGVEVAEGASGRRRYWTAEEKRRIVEQTLSSTLSVASLARQHGVNANQLFYWRKLYRAGQLGGESAGEWPGCVYCRSRWRAASLRKQSQSRA